MMQATPKPQFDPEPEEDLAAEPAEPISIPKPASGFDLNKFRAKRDPTLAGVATLLTALPVYKLSDARDFVRLHPDEDNYWTAELCLVAVPVRGSRRDALHLIEEELALQYLQPAVIRRYRLALGANPEGGFFLCTVPSQNLDNVWNADSLKGCEKAKSLWTKLPAEGTKALKGTRSTIP